MAVEAEAVSTPNLALADTDINWDRLDKWRFHMIGAVLFTVHPTAVVKTRMQVADSGLSHMPGFRVFRHTLKSDGIPDLYRGFGTSALGSLPGRVLHLTSLEISKDLMMKYTEGLDMPEATRVGIAKSDGIPGLYRGFGTSALGSLPGRVLHLTSLEISKDLMMKYTEGLDMPEATRVGIANGVAGMMSNLVSCAYFVPLDVISQRLMVQGLPGSTYCNGPLDITHKVIKAEGFRGVYRGFGLTVVTQSPASALWWGAYGAAQHIIWRSLGYRDDTDKKPSHMEMVTVQATAGMLAGACSSVITTPIDTVKTRLQVIDDYGIGRPSVLKITKALLEEDAWRGFYRGWIWTSLLKHVPLWNYHDSYL